MLTKIAAENYKSFKKLEVILSPITILLGANSCGKSSIINLLLLLAETSNSSNNLDSFLRINSDSVGLGETLNLIRDKNSSNELTLSFTFKRSSLKEEMSYLLDIDLVDKYYPAISLANRAIRTSKIPSEVKSKFLEHYNKLENASFSTSSDRTTEILQSYKQLIKIIRSYRKIIKQYDISTPNNLHSSSRSLSILHELSLSRLGNLINEVINLNNDERDIVPSKISYSLSYNECNSELELKNTTIFNIAEQKIIDIKVKSSSIQLTSDVFDESAIRLSKKEIIENINLKSITLMKEQVRGPFGFNHNRSKINNPYAEFMVHYISILPRKLTQELNNEKVSHVSPLRAFPQRYYLLEKSARHNQLNSKDGVELAEILKKRSDILEKINTLFEEFNLKIKVEKVNDIIHKITVEQNNVSLELTDVGFGISQVLPIIVQAYLSRESSITVIEQPEIHLHPKMQAWLTNVLVEIAKAEDKRFLIETHSDTIIRRLQLQLMDPEVNFSNKDLKIYNLERENDGNTKIIEVPFNDLGEIKWPDGFMDTEIQDTIKLHGFRIKKKKSESKNV